MTIPTYKTRIQLRKFVSWPPSDDNADRMEQVKTELESTGWEVIDHGLRGDEYIVEACVKQVSNHLPCS